MRSCDGHGAACPKPPGLNVAVATNDLISQKQFCEVGGPARRPQIAIIFSVVGHSKSR